MTSKAVDAILFDLGGVLIELGPSPVPDAALRGVDRFTLVDWFKSAIAVSFEKGQIDAREFAAALIEELGIDCDVDRLIDHFTRWPIGLFSGAEVLLPRLRRDYRLAVLTNTNELHWPRFDTDFKLTRYVDDIFASHRLGMSKPDAGIFEHVVAELGIAPARILFVDDNRVNVEAARRQGMQAEQVQGFAELTRLLIARGIYVVDD